MPNGGLEGCRATREEKQAGPGEREGGPKNGLAGKAQSLQMEDEGEHVVGRLGARVDATSGYNIREKKRIKPEPKKETGGADPGGIKRLSRGAAYGTGMINDANRDRKRARPCGMGERKK